MAIVAIVFGSSFRGKASHKGIELETQPGDQAKPAPKHKKTQVNLTYEFDSLVAIFRFALIEGDILIRFLALRKGQMMTRKQANGLWVVIHCEIMQFGSDPVVDEMVFHVSKESRKICQGNGSHALFLVAGSEICF